MAEHTIHEFRTNSRMRTRKFEHSWPIRGRQITQTTKSVRIRNFLHEVCHYFFMRLYFHTSLRARRAKQSPFRRGDCFVRGRPGAPPSAPPPLLPFPTYPATPEMGPGIGSVTFSDDFSDDSLWDTAVSNQGSAAISRNRLTLAVQPGVDLESLRRDVTLGNFYAEITARPSLCRGDDSYGILVRGIGTSYYRFILSCNSQVRAERVNGGVKLPIHEPVPSGDAPPGAPGEVRIGVWAVGSDIRLFLNGRYQFGINDKSFPSGALGVFVRSEAETPMSVTFSDLTVYDVDYVPPTRTPMSP